MKLRTNRNPVAQETFKALGTDIYVCETEDTRAHIMDGNCEGGETVYSRIYPLKQNEVTKSVVDSKHSLFLTIEDGEASKQRLIAEGVNIVELTPEEHAEWKEKTQVVYEKFEKTFSPGLIDKIKKA